MPHRLRIYRLHWTQRQMGAVSEIHMKTLFPLLSTLALATLLTGCHTAPRIRIPGGSVTAPADTGKPATASTSTDSATLTVPPGSTVTVTETAAQPATANTPAQPAKTETIIIPASPMPILRTQERWDAQTGTVDTTVAVARVEVPNCERSAPKSAPPPPMPFFAVFSPPKKGRRHHRKAGHRSTTICTPQASPNATNQAARSTFTASEKRTRQWPHVTACRSASLKPF